MKKFYFLFLALGFSGVCKAQNIIFTDQGLKQRLVYSAVMNIIATNAAGQTFKIDSDGDQEISIQEAALVYGINVSHLLNSGLPKIYDLTGLEHFPNLRSLSVADNLLYDTLNVSIFPMLKTLHCYGNNISALNLSGLSHLEVVNTNYCNNLTSINFTGNTALHTIYANSCSLTQVDLSDTNSLSYASFNYNELMAFNVGGSNPKQILIQYNPIVQIDLTGCSLLEELALTSSSISSIDLSNCVKLKHLALANTTTLATIDVSSCPDLLSLGCSNMPALTSINLKNGSAMESIYLQGSTNLQYICTDDIPAEEQLITQNLVAASISTAVLNSYCTFIPGGQTYTFTGNAKFDGNTNGCDDSDMGFGKLQIGISNGLQSGIRTSDLSGNYSIVVSEGSHTITPVLENPAYFTVSPSSISASFPAQTSPQTNNFCITPNGNHPDIDVNVIPYTSAVPGFDVIYKIMYRNIGNSMANGSINLTYEDAIFDFVDAIPANNLLPEGIMAWNYTNLKPFETREIYVTLNLNGPMETPAVNGGDVVSLVANSTITNGVDENPNDNTMNLMQTVVNAMDPNDKTCLEGNMITPEMVGKYVHYKIRFENEGTAPAQNIVVKDMIDLTKFDINSLVALDSNYLFETRITGNKVEFIFQGINLAFEDDLNDGYVVFKIKTLPTLVTGDTFSNTASIYFDYNFPVITDPAVTTVQVLGTSDFVFSDSFVISPNPTSGFVNITAKDTTELQSVSVYNVLGQLVLVVPNAKGLKGVDVSQLSAGNYFMKVVSDKGNAVTKFVKN